MQAQRPEIASKFAGKSRTGLSKRLDRLPLGRERNTLKSRWNDGFGVHRFSLNDYTPF
jgi:hypothetical protein